VFCILVANEVHLYFETSLDLTKQYACLPPAAIFVLPVHWFEFACALFAFTLFECLNLRKVLSKGVENLVQGHSCLELKLLGFELVGGGWKYLNEIVFVEICGGCRRPTFLLIFL
jgi:hypothetical protein